MQGFYQLAAASIKLAEKDDKSSKAYRNMFSNGELLWASCGKIAPYIRKADCREMPGFPEKGMYKPVKVGRNFEPALSPGYKPGDMSAFSGFIGGEVLENLLKGASFVPLCEVSRKMKPEGVRLMLSALLSRIAVERRGEADKKMLLTVSDDLLNPILKLGVMFDVAIDEKSYMMDVYIRDIIPFHCMLMPFNIYVGEDESMRKVYDIFAK